MNIVIDIRALVGAKVSGVTVYIKNLIETLIKIDKKNNYFLYYNGFRKVNDLRIKNIPLVVSKIPNKLLNFSLAFLRWPKLDKLIEKKIGQKVDVFFSPDPRPCALSKNVRKITTFHDLSFEKFPQSFSLKTRLWHKLLNPKREAETSDLIIAVSSFTKKELIQSYEIPEEKIKVIYHGIFSDFQQITDKDKLNLIRKKYELPEEFIFTLSTLEPRKNIQGLIEAFSLLKKQRLFKGKLIIGGEENKNIFQAIKIQSNEDVKFIGLVKEEDKPSLYSLAKLFVFPSFYEGFGFPVLEALKCGCPVVSSKNTSMEEILGDHGIFIDPRDIEDLEKGIIQGLNMKNREEFRKKGIEWTKRFTWERCAGEVAEIITQSSKLKVQI